MLANLDAGKDVGHADCQVRQAAALTIVEHFYLRSILDPKSPPPAPRVLRHGGPQLIRALGEGLSHGNPEQRGAAAAALGVIGPPAADTVPLLRGALSDQQRRVRANAVAALALVAPEDDSSLPLIEQWIQQPERVASESGFVSPYDENCRYREIEAAATALSLRGERSAVYVPMMASQVRRLRNETLKATLCSCLGRLGPVAAEAVPALRNVADSKTYSEYLQSAAREALKRIEATK
jgi:HEAT repeat protein